MKRVTAFIGSARKRNTYKVTKQFLNNLQALGEIEYEIVTLSDYKLGACRGCQLCFDKGPEFCPLKDNRDVLVEKIAASDGVVFATPNYCYQVSGILKTFLDRFGYALHRPCYFGKTATSIVCQAVGGGDDILKYLDTVAFGLGFTTVKGSCHTAFEPWTEKDQQKVDRALADHSRRFYAALTGPAYPVPTWFMLMYFHIGRSLIQRRLDDRNIDYRYYRDKGWFASDYFYPTRLGTLKKTAGKLFDRMAPTLLRMMS